MTRSAPSNVAASYHSLRREHRVEYVVQLAEQMAPRSLSKDQAARSIGCSVRTLERYIDEGRLAVVRPDEDGRVYVRVCDIDAFLAAHRVPPLAAD